MLKKTIILAFALFASSAYAEIPAIKIQNVWARPTIGDLKTSAVYFDITSSKEDVLLKASTDIAEMTHIHKTVDNAGVKQMININRMTLPAGELIHFAPGGNHIMLMDLKKPLNYGDKFSLKLEFQHAGTITEEVTVTHNQE